jgi:hypothetical protein
MDEIERIREKAERWRQMATKVTDARAIEALNSLVRDAEDEIVRLRGEGSERDSG